MSQAPVELELFRQRLRTHRAWPFVIVSAAVTAWLLWWHARSAHSAATAPAEPGAPVSHAAPLSVAANRHHAAFSREATRPAGPQMDVRGRMPGTQGAAGTRISVARPATSAVRSEPSQPSDRVGPNAPSAQVKRNRAPASARTADELLLKRLPWPE